MSEKSPTSKPEETPQTAEEREKEGLELYEWYEAWMTDHPYPDFLQLSPEECAEAVAGCEATMDSFEQTHDLEALRAITQFDSREDRRNSIRQPALKTLSFIFLLLKHLGFQGTLQKETREALGLRYEKLSNAVGNITIDKNGKIFDVVVHDRRTPFPGDELPR